MVVMEIPERLRDRPLDKRGRVIPWMAQVYDDGKVAFGKNVEPLRDEAVRKYLCGQCGKMLDYWKYFIIDEFIPSGKDALFEPAMHIECARYAFAVCPFLGHPGYNANAAPIERYTVDQARKEVVFNPFPGGEPRPERMGLVKTRNYKVERKADKNRAEGWLVCVPAKLELVEWF